MPKANLTENGIPEDAVAGLSPPIFDAPPNVPISVPNIMQHLEAFGAAADLHGGTRSVGPGYDASAEYNAQYEDEEQMLNLRQFHALVCGLWPHGSEPEDAAADDDSEGEEDSEEDGEEERDSEDSDSDMMM